MAASAVNLTSDDVNAWLDGYLPAAFIVPWVAFASKLMGFG
jgi:hypothetical protein